MSQILLCQDADGVRTLTLNRPERGNALSSELQQALVLALEHAAAEVRVRVVVLAASGDKAFCSGGDLSLAAGDEGFLATHQGRHLFGDLLLRLWEFPKPTVCRVHAPVLAGGMGLLLACDMAVASENAHFSTPEIARGLFPMMISTLMLRQLSRRHAYELMLLGERWTSAQALAAGLVNRVVPSDRLDEEVKALTSRLASMSPAIMALGKRALATSAEMDVRQAVDFLHGQLSLNLLAEDAMEGVSAFLEKRTPSWKGR